MADPYSVGTITVANGGTTVTGTGTFWVGSVRKNDMLFDPAQGLMARVTADPASDTSLSITAWAGTGLTDAAYEIIAGDSTTNAARLRELLAEMSVVEANGRGLFYRFSDTTTDADPGAGYIRLNNADPTLATAAYIDVLDANGATVSGEIDTWDDSTSLGKGNLWVRGIADPSAFHAYELTGSVVDGTGYRKLTLTYIGGSGSFAADDELMVAFARTGDTGEGYVTDVTVAEPSELTALEGEAAGYLVFVTDLQTDFGAYSGRSGVVELIAGPDWQLVAVYTGPKGDAGDQGDRGWSPQIVVVEDGARRVHQLAGYVGGAGTAPTANVGEYLKGDGTFTATIGDAADVRGPAGLNGSGTVASVEPGTGIAVDNTDPTAPVISASVASQAEAEAGTATDKLMTPQRTAQAIAALAQGYDPDKASMALEIADLKGARFNMSDGVADSMDSESGVDTGTSTGEVYDSGNDLYSPSSPAGQGTTRDVATALSHGGNTLVCRSYTLGAGQTVSKLGIDLVVAGTVNMKIMQRNSAGNYTVIRSEAFSHGGAGFQDFTLATPYTVPGSGTFHVGLQFDGTLGARTDASVARAYIAGNQAEGTTAGGYTEDTSLMAPTRVVYLPNNMTLVSNAYTADAEADTARLALQVVENETIAINTDLTGEVSRDGGTTWTAATLVYKSTNGGAKLYEDTGIDISGQPSGTSMKWRVKTLNNKDIDVSGVVMQWVS